MKSKQGVPENTQAINRETRLSVSVRTSGKVLEGASVVGMECWSAAIGAGLDRSDRMGRGATAKRSCVSYQFLSPRRLVGVTLPDGTSDAALQVQSYVLYIESAFTVSCRRCDAL